MQELQLLQAPFLCSRLHLYNNSSYNFCNNNNNRNNNFSNNSNNQNGFSSNLNISNISSHRNRLPLLDLFFKPPII
ncbi:hypothetical protein CLOM_g7351 [Closterium sp. NIES-68]|nr:hypothetical protein CLOM_g7351 [Closterium sp. NIES-68]